ncbi:SF0329 family protein [Cytobacillus gottheilii]|uniref:Nonribosomal peptide synthetase n=1 Tax=Cytobacillus gottheilii TaxID=859144 RepID=A0ABX8FAJ3_9BACI|nr:nonribosomal peptide synthetase [Cytobacillus gottheilii]QVY61120.1 nonribosomal peptide synthetase [Cytobacillus gottheilii]
MKWTKLKKLLENRLCESLKGRLEIRTTAYRKAHDQPSRMWITLDKKEIYCAADQVFEMNVEEQYQLLKEEQQLEPIPYDSDWTTMFQSKERAALLDAYEEAEQIVIKKNVIAEYSMYHSLLEYIQLSIDEALQSQDPVIKAFAMLDRRLGKRRLEKLKEENKESHSFIQLLLQIRCEAEGLINKKSTHLTQDIVQFQ